MATNEHLLRECVERLLEYVDAPEKNCSCHIFPPCNDCVDYGDLRELQEASKEALATTATSQPSNTKGQWVSDKEYWEVPTATSDSDDVIDCPKCFGSRIKGEKHGVRCTTCNGRGYINATSDSDSTDAVRYRWLKKNSSLTYLRKNQNEYFSDYRMIYNFPILIGINAIGDEITLDEAIDMKIDAPIATTKKETE